MKLEWRKTITHDAQVDFNTWASITWELQDGREFEWAVTRLGAAGSAACIASGSARTAKGAKRAVKAWLAKRNRTDLALHLQHEMWFKLRNKAGEIQTVQPVDVGEYRNEYSSGWVRLRIDNGGKIQCGVHYFDNNAERL